MKLLARPQVRDMISKLRPLVGHICSHLSPDFGQFHPVFVSREYLQPYQVEINKRLAGNKHGDAKFSVKIHDTFGCKAASSLCRMAVAALKTILSSMKTAVGTPASVTRKPASIPPSVIWKRIISAPALWPLETSQNLLHSGNFVSKNMSMSSAARATAPTQKPLYDAFVNGMPAVEQLEPCECPCNACHQWSLH